MAKTKYVAGRPVEIGLGPDGTDVKHFEPGETVPGAADLPGLQGLLRFCWVVPAARYDDYQAAGDADVFGQELAATYEEASR